jgi:hypothetical protein
MAYPWSSHDLLTASDLNAAFDTAVVSTGLTLDTYTPTLTQSGAVTKTVEFASYHTVAGITHVVVSLSVTGTGTAANAVQIGVPVAQTSFRLQGVGSIFDASVSTWYHGIAVFVSSTVVQIFPNASTTALGATSFTAALASGDKVCLNLQYL